MKENTLTEDFELFEAGRNYNRRIGLYETVDRNERFYRGDQWQGVNAGDLPTPVFNIFKRVINYYISTILSQKISLRFSAEGIGCLFDEEQKKQAEDACRTLTGFLNYRMERDRMEKILAKGLLDAAVTGDFFCYVYWDPAKRTAQGFTGDFVTSLVDSTNVFFGNVNSDDVQDQPYILISGRELVTRLREEARRSGAGGEEIAKIEPDSDVYETAGDAGKKELEGTKATFVIKLYKKDGTVHFRKSCRGAVIAGDRDTGLTLYPVAMMNWESVKNSYHGHAVATTLTENQLYVNKAFAMVMKHMMDLSFSKVLYNSNVIDEWTNTVGESIAVNGPVDGVAAKIEAGGMQTGFLDVIRMTLNVTKELMGATDAALGDVRPDNTSAIIALQQSSAVPLELQRRALYRMMEDLGMIWLDFIFRYYDPARMILYREKGTLRGGTLRAGDLKNVLFSCAVEAGASSYWSEIATVATLDKLLQIGAITFPQYLERLPDGYLTKKEELLQEARESLAESKKAEEPLQ